MIVSLFKDIIMHIKQQQIFDLLDKFFSILDAENLKLNFTAECGFHNDLLGSVRNHIRISWTNLELVYSEYGPQGWGSESKFIKWYDKYHDNHSTTTVEDVMKKAALALAA